MRGVAKAEALGPTPLEVLLESMHAARAEGERAEAVECAKAAAPYVHPRLAPTSPPAPVHERVDYNVLSETELDQLEKIYSKLLNPPPAGEAPPAQSRVMRGRYPGSGPPRPAATCVYRKLDPDVLMMKSAENRM